MEFKMKKTLLILTSVLFITSAVFPQSKVNINNLDQYGDKMYKTDDERPYTGKVFDLYKSNGNKKVEGYYNDGLRNRKWEWWNEDGKMDSSGTYEDGIKNGKWTYWYANESKKKEGMYKDGLIDGLWTYWDNGGNKYQGIVVRKGEKDGEFLFSYSNHHMKMSAHGTFKNGIENGTWTWWYENGHKWFEGNYKDGELDSYWTKWDKYDRVIENVYVDSSSNKGLLYLALKVDLLTFINNLSFIKDKRLENIISSVMEKIMESPYVDFFTVFEEVVIKDGIELSRYFHEYGASHDDIMIALKDEADDAINNVMEILQNRLDQFGVSESTIQKHKHDSYGITVTLPPIQDTYRLRSLLGSTAMLEFYMLKDIGTTNELLMQIDRTLMRYDSIATVNKLSKTEKTKITSTGDDNTISISELFGETEDDKTISVSDLFGETESYGVNEDMSDERSFTSMLRPIMGTIGVPEQNIYTVRKILERPEVQEKLSSFHGKLMFSHKSEEYIMMDGNLEKVYGLLFLEDKAELNGSVVKEAKATLVPQGDPFSGQPIVKLFMNADGVRTWSRFTGANIGRRVAIVLDKKVHMAPVIRNKISDGGTLIEGFADIKEAKDFAIVLRSGALPVSVNLVEERYFNPSIAVINGSWGNPDMNDAIESWEFSFDNASFNYTNAMFGGSPKYGFWEVIGEDKIRLNYFSGSEVSKTDTLKIISNRTFKVDRTTYQKIK